MTTLEKLQKLYIELQGANIDQYVDKKNTGRTVLDYLSWGAAVDFFTKGCHKLNLDWTWDKKFIDMQSRGSFVETVITIFDAENGETIEKTMVLPCMTPSMTAAKDADVIVINKTMMRCLVKNMTQFGLGLKLYLKDFSELNEVKMASENKEKHDKRVQALKDRITELLNKIDPSVDVSQFAKYKDSESIEELTAIGTQVKKICDTQGAL